MISASSTQGELGKSNVMKMKNKKENTKEHAKEGQNNSRV